MARLFSGVFAPLRSPMSVEDALLADLSDGGDNDDGGAMDLEQLLRPPARSVRRALEQFGVARPYDIARDSRVRPYIGHLRRRLEEYDDGDYAALLESVGGGGAAAAFARQVNPIMLLIAAEIDELHAFNILHYRLVFPELETIVAGPVAYARVVLVVGQDLPGAALRQRDLQTAVSHEKVLVISMAALQHAGGFVFSEADFDLVRQSCALVLELHQLQQELLGFLARKVARLAPNVDAVVGAVTAAQLLTAAGSLPQLAATPSCNVPALGVAAMQAQATTRVRQPGFLYHCDLVQGLPPDIQRKAMRLVSAKVVLAARVDLAKSSPDGAVGAAFRREVAHKLEQLLAPPPQQVDKALPVPVDHKLKKRAGRRFRKARERFQMSDTRRAQNKMAFGQQEDTVMDAFGEEIGLGMSRASGPLAPSASTAAKTSKAMRARLQAAPQRHDLESLVFGAAAGQPPPPTATDLKWFSGMKRKRE